MVAISIAKTMVSQLRHCGSDYWVCNWSDSALESDFVGFGASGQDDSESWCDEVSLDCVLDPVKTVWSPFLQAHCKRSMNGPLLDSAS